MMYIDAVCNGIDDIPTVSKEAREEAQKIYEKEGLDGLTAKLKELDPVWYEKVDLKNHERWKQIQDSLKRERGFWNFLLSWTKGLTLSIH